MFTGVGTEGLARDASFSVPPGILSFGTIPALAALSPERLSELAGMLPWLKPALL